MWSWLRRWLGSASTPQQVTTADLSEAAPSTGMQAPTLTTVTSKVQDDGLLDRAKQQWQFGQWVHLAGLVDMDLAAHPDRAKLALLAAAGLAQTGQAQEARRWVATAKEWGCTQKLINQVLIAGVQNHLAHAAYWAGDETRATHLLNDAVKTAMPQLDSQLLTKARLGSMRDRLLAQVGDTARQIESTAGNTRTEQGKGAPFTKELSAFTPKLVAEFDLGEAWAGNTVNTVIFRHHGIFTHQGMQFTSFYVDEHTLRFISRRLSDDHISQYDLAGEYNLKDAHNSISMGVDRQGYLHACYDHHASKLRYRRSLQPLSIDGWTDDLPMTGQHEDKVTYPTFILPRGDYPLTLLYRDGTHNKGSARLKYYDEQTGRWKDKPTPILSGAEQKPWTSNAYWNHPAIGSDGSLHLSFVWRTGVLGEEQLVNNINIGYAWSPDNGHHWYTLQGQPYQVPITPTTAETIWPVPPGSNLINQCSMALDKNNRPHIVFYANDANGVPQYQHLRYDGKQWHHQIISNRESAFRLVGGGTLKIPISRPEILIDEKSDVYVIMRGDLTDNRLAFALLPAPKYIFNQKNAGILVNEDVGFSEPVIDRERWLNEKVLSILVQYNEQRNHDLGHSLIACPVKLQDIYFKND